MESLGQDIENKTNINKTKEKCEIIPFDINKLLEEAGFTDEPVRTGIQGKDNFFSEFLLRFPGKNINIFDFLETLKKEDRTFELLKKMLSFNFEKAGENITNSINLYLGDLEHSDFITTVEYYEDNSDIKNSNIVFEILEEPHGTINETVINNLLLLQKKGFQIAIDDFTPNISENNISLEILNTIMLNGIIPNYVKIDGTYVRKLLGSEVDQKERLLFFTMITSLKSQGIKIIGEWIENNAEGIKASKYGFDGFQGRELTNEFSIEEIKSFKLYTNPKVKSFSLYDTADDYTDTPEEPRNNIRSFQLNNNVPSFSLIIKDTKDEVQNVVNDSIAS